MNLDERMFFDTIISLDTGDIFYDVGANKGRYTLASCAITGAENVYAFEPHPTNYSVLSKLLSRGLVSQSKLFDVALYDENKEMPMKENMNITGKAYLGEGTERVEVRTADSIDIPPPNIVKIDVEGAELRVLKGMESKLRESNDVKIFIEVHRKAMKERFGDTEGELIDYLTSLGFRKEDEHESGGQRVYYRLKRYD